LRTPLAAIRSSVEVALGSNRSPIEYEELLSEIIDEGNSLESLVNQLLLLSETEADGLKQRGERFAIDNVVHKAVEMCRGVAEAKEIQISEGVIDRADLAGNRQHLRQVLNNLLDNAIKFTPEGGVVSVSLTRHSTLPEVTLEVSDSGIGIRAEDTPRIFERFFRADNARRRSSEFKGTGLGLSICRAVAEAHGGEISVQSQLGKGTTFIVVFPLAPPEDNF
jgi:signal transduction histidine kinase